MKRELAKAEKELEINLEKTKICRDESSKLVGKIYEMKHGVISKKTGKCMSNVVLFSLISGFIFLYVGVNFIPSLWLAVLYLILDIIAVDKMYIKKVNNKDYMFGELEQNLEYRELVEQKNLKNKSLNDLAIEEERLNEVITDLYLETQYLYMMISEFVDEEEIQREIDLSLEKGKELELKHNALVRKKIKDND